MERTPERFALQPGAQPGQVAREVQAALERTLASRSFSYRRSDGSQQTLTLADLVARSAALELAYNPASCVEERWGAPAGTAERASCKRAPPAEQRARMLQYRDWFHTRTRPARDD